MMIPDYALVAEVMLFSEGFNDAKNLSKKMVQLYKLASEQLSQQVGQVHMCRGGHIKIWLFQFYVCADINHDQDLVTI